MKKKNQNSYIIIRLTAYFIEAAFESSYIIIFLTNYIVEAAFEKIEGKNSLPPRGDFWAASWPDRPQAKSIVQCLS